jgi:hypothetical protein
MFVDERAASDAICDHFWSNGGDPDAGEGPEPPPEPNTAGIETSRSAPDEPAAAAAAASQSPPPDGGGSNGEEQAECHEPGSVPRHVPAKAAVRWLLGVDRNRSGYRQEHNRHCPHRR